MKYKTEMYVAGGTCVQAYTDDGEPYATCSVCLAEYGFVPPVDHIVVPTYELFGPAADRIIEDLAEEVLGTFTFGPYNAEAKLIRLKDEYVPWNELDLTIEETIEDLMFNGMTRGEAEAFAIEEISAEEFERLANL